MIAGAHRWVLPPDRVPPAWCNVVPHLSAPQPPIGAQLDAVLSAEMVEQGRSTQPWVDVPDDVLDVLRGWRPTPLVRARRLERALATPARIYFKDESVSPTGSHGPDAAVAQAFYARREGMGRLVTASGSGRWGSAVALACALFDLECTVYMPAVAPDRRAMVEAWGGVVVPSAESAVDDALLDAASRSQTQYAPGAGLNHVLLHQTLVGLEAREQLALAGEGTPDVVIGSGAGLAGLALPFVADAGVRLMAVEPSSRPTLTSGRFADGQAPVIAALLRAGRLAAVAYPPGPVSEAATRFARAQGPIPGPATSLTVKAVADEALLAREEDAGRVILFAYAGPPGTVLACS